MKYKDSTPGLHVGDSAFEDWYASRPGAELTGKAAARDAYAAGMGDPLVKALDMSPGPIINSLPYMGKPADTKRDYKGHGIGTGCSVKRAHIAPERDDL